MENFKHGLYDKSKVKKWYFWTSEKTVDEELSNLWLLDTPEPKKSGLLADIKTTEDTSFIKWVWKWLVDVWVDIFKWWETLFKDIDLVRQWRLEETQGLFGKVLQSWEDNIERVKEFNKIVDETGGSAFDKLVFAGISTARAGWDIIWDTFISSLKTIAPEDLENDVVNLAKNFAQSETWQKLIWELKAWWDKVKQFEDSSPQANMLSKVLQNTGLVWLELIGGKKAWEVVSDLWDITSKGLNDGIDVIQTWSDKIIEWAWNLKDTISDIKLPTRAVDEIPTELRTVTWKIWDTEVQVPEVKRPLTERAADKLSPTITNKTLAWSAVRPRTIWKNRKQKLESIAQVEERTKNFYNNIRTGILEWDISTLENSAQSIVANLDTVGARIGNAVQKVDGTIQFDNELTDNIINALSTKGSEVSPASPILNKFFETLGDWNLSVSEAYDLKKAYSNEVSKLVRGWDAGTAQYKALADWVNFLNTKIDEIIETKLWGEFANDKKLYRDLLFLADDMVASSLVDGRRTANTLAERIGMLESITSPITSTKWKLISASERVNTRGGAWEELIKRYDEEAIKNLGIK